MFSFALLRHLEVCLVCHMCMSPHTIIFWHMLWICTLVTLVFTRFPFAHKWLFCLCGLNLHTSDPSVYALWIYTPVTFLIMHLESVYQWPFYLCTSNLHASDPSVYVFQICMPKTLLHLFSRSSGSQTLYCWCPLFKFGTRPSVSNLSLNTRYITSISTHLVHV